MNAFAHALAIALLRPTQFTLLHAHSPGAAPNWRQTPSVRRTLESWGLLEPGSPRSAVFQRLAIDVRKVELGGLDPLRAILKYQETHTPDLLVLGTEGRDGLPRWLNPSFAEQLSRRSETLTLFVPNQGRGFVSLPTGQIHLSHILIPVDRDPHPGAALTYAMRAAGLSEAPVQISLVHVGDPHFSWPPIPQQPHITWSTESRQGEVVDQILTVAQALPADLIIMTTQGHHGIWDALRGSTTEQVLRQSLCPLLAVPAYLSPG